MLPPGHIAAGFLTAEAVVKIVHPNLTPSQINKILVLGAVAGFIPDLDYFYAFFKERAFFIKNTRKNNHRRLLGHAPILWLIAGLAVYFLSGSEFGRLAGLVVWLASWSHFLFDTIEDGVMWMWPFNKKIYAFTRNLETRELPKELSTSQKFVSNWWIKLKFYINSYTFYFEIIILVTAIINLYYLFFIH